MEVTSIVVVLILVCSVGLHGATALQKDCEVPADVVFILDESNSIPPDDFVKQLEFVNKIINHFTVNEENMHIGVMSFGRGVNTDILALGEFLSDPEAMKNTILAYNDERPSNNDRTRTDLALQHARTDMFRNARRGIPHIAIIITDGEPNLPTGTAAEGRRITKQKADQLKATGVTLFAIGVGKASNRDQLLEMATDNSDEYVFLVDSYSVLEEIEELFTIKVCPKEPNIDGCDGFRPLDVMFAAANEAGVADTVYTIDFFTSLTRGMVIAPDRVKVSLAPRNCLDLDGIAFDDYTQKLPLERALLDRRLLETNLATQLDDMVEGFSADFGARPLDDPESEVVRIALVVVDNRIAAPFDVADKAKELEADGIRLYVIGVGQHVDEAELKTIVSNRRYFYANSYSDLPTLVDRIMDTFCTEIMEPIAVY